MIENKIKKGKLYKASKKKKILKKRNNVAVIYLVEFIYKFTVKLENLMTTGHDKFARKEWSATSFIITTLIIRIHILFLIISLLLDNDYFISKKKKRKIFKKKIKKRDCILNKANKIQKNHKLDNLQYKKIREESNNKQKVLRRPNLSQSKLNGCKVIMDVNRESRIRYIVLGGAVVMTVGPWIAIWYPNYSLEKKGSPFREVKFWASQSNYVIFIYFAFKRLIVIMKVVLELNFIINCYILVVIYLIEVIYFIMEHENLKTTGSTINLHIGVECNMLFY